MSAKLTKKIIDGAVYEGDKHGTERDVRWDNILIGRVLNHTNPQTTAIYARLGDDLARQALEKHGQTITAIDCRKHISARCCHGFACAYG